MTLALAEPSATDDVVHLADYLELKAIQADDKNASALDLIRDVTRAGTVEVLDGDPHAEDGLVDPDDEETMVDPGGEVLEGVGQGAIAELEFRSMACGGAYPFDVDEHGVLTLKPGGLASPYVFMLLLSRFGGKPKKGNRRVTQVDATKVFEDLSEVAAAEYFGWDDDHVLVYPFGFPRKMSPKGFEDAMNDLCKLTHEGQGCRSRPNLDDQKDATLDVVVVRRFPDRRIGQMIGFGQCATGADWRDKLSDLQPEAFCKLWMLDQPAVTPVRMFFVPHAIEEDRWIHTTMNAGVVFDRSRMAYYTTDPSDSALAKRISDWSAAVVAAKVLP